MRIGAEFVTSAAGAGDFPRDGLPEIAFVGRSNVGKSSLINALVRARVARTSAAPGKTRLANVYRIVRDGSALYLVDLPGYGYTRGGAGGFERLIDEYFGRASGRAALLLVDARHPGLASDVDAWRWLQAAVDCRDIVATKIDKLARGQRIRALGTLESVFHHPVLAVSAVTGEGMEDLWKLIDRLTNSRNNSSSRRRSSSPRKATAPPPRTR